MLGDRAFVALWRGANGLDLLNRSVVLLLSRTEQPRFAARSPHSQSGHAVGASARGERHRQLPVFDFVRLNSDRLGYQTVKLQFPRFAGLIPAILALLVVSALSSTSLWAAQASDTVGGNATINSTTEAVQLRQCLSDLKAADVEFRDLGTQTKNGCLLEGAIELDAVASPFGKVSLTAKPTMACVFARHFTLWIRDVGAPLALAYMGSKLTAIETGPGLVCRNRIGEPGEKLSEHAKGDAIDIMAFRFESGQRLSIKEASASTKIDGVLVKTLRTTACGYFTTVLGPGSNEAHKEHLHFDYGLHGQTDNYRICE
jgi:hypothetical protein